MGATLDKQNAEALAKAQVAFAAPAAEGMQPVLECNGFPNHKLLAEYDVTLNPNPMVGLIHEDIERAAEIAAEHGGRLWLMPRGVDGGSLSIVWPLPEQADGPDGQEEDPERKLKEKAAGVRRAAG
jgi:hypothetical protein